MTTDTHHSRSLRVPLHPALILAIFSGLAFGLRHLLPHPLDLSPNTRSTLQGASLLGVLLLLGSSFWIYHRSGTSPDYGHEVRQLLTSGPYRYSRNPLFIANALLFAALLLEVNCVWALALLPFHVLALDRLVICREEQFLTLRFGESYVEYCRRVRRWL